VPERITVNHIIEINNLTPDTRHLSPEAQRELAAKIPARPVFESAPRLRSFLIYIVDRASSGKLDELSEQHIGYEVFQRDSDYDTTTDTIVRSSARQLRAKLIEYYAGQGASSDWVLEIPKGGYLPRFHPRLVISAAIPTVAPSDPPSRKANYWPWVSLGLALALLAVLVRSLLPASPETPFSVLCLEGNRRLKVLVADAGLVLYTGLTGRTPSLQEYVDHKLPPPAWWPDDQPAAHFFEILADRRNTDWAGVASFTSIHRAHPHAVARNLHRLMAYKDEYEVARLLLLPEARDQARKVGGARSRTTWLLHPPMLRAMGMKNKLRFGRWATPAFWTLRAMRRLRGTPFDFFGWAKVRRLKYLHGQTYLAGSSFGYHGEPKQILKGRAIASLLLRAYVGLSQLNELAGAVAGLVLTAAMPWLVVKAMKFRTRMTSWRGIRFDHQCILATGHGEENIGQNLGVEQGAVQGAA